MVQYPWCCWLCGTGWVCTRCSSLAKIKGIGKVFRFFGALMGLSILKIQMECELTSRLLKSIGLGKMIFCILPKNTFWNKSVCAELQFILMWLLLVLILKMALHGFAVFQQLMLLFRCLVFVCVILTLVKSM